MAVPVLVALYLALLVLPVVAAWIQDLPPRRWQQDLSSGLALCAFAGVMLEFLLSGRIQTISRQIGIDGTMRVHQLMARTFTLILLAHPFLYLGGGGGYPMPWDTTRQAKLDFSFLATATGLVAWIALALVVLLGILREQRGGSYEAWRAWHGIGALIIAAAGTLHTVSAGRYSADPFLFWFWIALFALALLIMAWIYVAKPILQLRHPYTVRSVRKIADRTWELVIEPQRAGEVGGDRGEALPFTAGQFVWLNVGHSPFSLNENPFSIASAPQAREGEGGHLAFVIKEVGDFTRSLRGIETGARAFVDGPYGNMTVAGKEGAGIALYAGGVGIAPLLSMLRDLYDRGDRRPLLLLYANRAADQIVYREELEAISRKLDLQVTLFLSEPPPDWAGRTGMIDAGALDAALRDRGIADPADWLHVICGPLAMIERVEETLRARGVPARCIISERFYYD